MKLGQKSVKNLVGFLGDLKTPKINWPLAGNSERAGGIFFLFYKLIFIYLFKYEIIVSRNDLSLGYSERDIRSVRYLSFSLLFSNKSYHALSNTFFVYIISLFLVIFDQILSFEVHILNLYVFYVERILYCHLLDQKYPRPDFKFAYICKEYLLIESK